jgi:hypothetical protein
LNNIEELARSGKETLMEIAKDLNENRVDRITFQEKVNSGLQRVENEIYKLRMISIK